MLFLLHLRYPSGREQTLSFPTAQARGLYLITLSAQPVAFQTEDRAEAEAVQS
jgi:hypothetical protein